MTSTESKTTATTHTFDASQNMEKEKWMETFFSLFPIPQGISTHGIALMRQKAGLLYDTAHSLGEKSMLENAALDTIKDMLK